MKHVFLKIQLCAIFTSFLLGCGTSSTGESISLPEPHLATVRPGDTTDVYVAIKKYRDAQGRMQTDDKYTKFYLVSDDTSIVKIVEDRRVYGSKLGSTKITVKDQSSKLVSPKYDFTVFGI